MLYIDLEKNETYTAYRALHNICPNVVPLRLPIFSRDELNILAKGSFGQLTAKILNVFFGLNISDSSLEACFKIHPLIPDNLDRKTLVIKIVEKSQQSISGLVDDIYTIMTGKAGISKGWPCIAIRISLLFGLYADLKRCGVYDFDIAVHANDRTDFIAAYYAQKMGLPVNTIICGCSVEEGIWQLLHTGTLHDQYCSDIAAILHVNSENQARDYCTACTLNRTFCLEQDQQRALNTELFTSVISSDRVDELKGNSGKTFDKTIDPGAVISYCALQDYRAVSGINRTTLLFSRI